MSNLVFKFYMTPNIRKSTYLLENIDEQNLLDIAVISQFKHWTIVDQYLVLLFTKDS